MTQHTPRTDVYATVTNKIIADLEKGNLMWLQPWQAGHRAGPVSRPLRGKGIPYRGVNILMLWGTALEKGYSCPIWLTYRQASELGGQVRKGEKGTLVVYANKITKSDTNEQGEASEIEIPYLKGYTVFNVEQIDGLPADYYAPAAPISSANKPLDALAAFFATTKATLQHGGDRAFYSPSRDLVQMPDLNTFKSSESYYATLAHEMTHWTRHETRLNREFGQKRFGDEGYAVEELVAEIGAAFLCADLQITPETRDDHAAYIASWLKVLKDDKRAIFTAASHAQKAADYLHSLQPNSTAVESAELAAVA